MQLLVETQEKAKRLLHFTLRAGRLLSPRSPFHDRTERVEEYKYTGQVHRRQTDTVRSRKSFIDWELGRSG